MRVAPLEGVTMLLCALTVVLLLLTACSSHGESADRIEAVASWAATGEMVTGAWMVGAVPRHYGVRALGRVREAVAAHTSRLRGGRSQVPGRLATALQRLDRTVADASAALDAGRRDRAEEARQRFRAEAGELREIAQHVRQRP